MRHLSNCLKFTALFTLISLAVFAGKPAPAFVEMKTSRGSVTVMLYPQTPLHKKMFLEMVRKGAYNNVLFNRVIKSFVIQGGELDDIIMEKEKTAGKGDGPRIPAELNDSLFHKKGALGAGRNDNPEKKSFINQFYIVQGKQYTDAQLNEVEVKRLQGRKIPEWQREIYRTTGGTPFLDHNYTIFGEVVQGLDIVDIIASVKTDSNDLPLEDVKVSMRILSKKESRRLIKTLKLNIAA